MPGTPGPAQLGGATHASHHHRLAPADTPYGDALSLPMVRLEPRMQRRVVVDAPTYGEIHAPKNEKD
jgi:hypothetical protein